MKNMFRISVFIMAGLFFAACENKETTVEVQNKLEQNQDKGNDSAEELRMLTSEKGDTIYLTYFAKGDVVAVRLKKDDQERVLEPNGTSEKGNPILSDGEYGWEIFTDGRSGRLFTKDSKGILFKEK